jgi:hypothetical protein
MWSESTPKNSLRDRGLPFPPRQFWWELTPDQPQIRQLDKKSAKALELPEEWGLLEFSSEILAVDEVRRHLP